MDAIKVRRQDQAAFVEADWGSLTWYANGELNNSKDLTVGCCKLKPGCANPRHYHPNCSEVLVVVKGQIRHTKTEGESVQMQVGDTVSIPANVWHQAENVGTDEAELFIAFSSADRQTVSE